MSKPIKLLEFGDFLLDTEQPVLWQHGKRVPLSPRPMAMLLMLVENRQRIVSHDELMERVWAGVIVEEANIATNIARLRRALANGQAENGNARQYIETVPGYGYQFVAEVRERADEEKSQPVATTPAPLPAPPPEPEPVVVSPVQPAPLLPEPIKPDPPRPFYRDWRYHLGFVMLLALAALAALWPPPKPPFLNPEKFGHRPVTSWANRFGDEEWLMIRPSPDGRMVAYSKSESDQTDIFIQEVEKQNPRRVTSDPWPDFSPVWSPDGKQLAYVSQRKDVIELAVTDLLTRERKVVGTMPTSVRLLRWSKRTPRLIYTDEKNVFAISLTAPETTNLTNFKEERGGPTKFGLSLDEEKIAYVRTVDGKSALFAARLDGRDTVQLIHAGQGLDYPEWFADNEHIVYGSRYGGAGQVSVISARGGKPIQLTIGRETASLHHLSPDGKRIFYTTQQFNGDLFRCDLKTSEETELAAGPGLKIWAEASPDGKNLIFQRTDDDTRILRSLILQASLAEPNRLPMELAAEGFDARWSPSGEQVAFLRLAEKGYQLWLLEQQNTAPRLLTSEISLQQGFMNGTWQWHQLCNYSWSPRGRRLAFSARAGGITNIMTMSADGQSQTQLSHNTDPKLSLLSPLWSPDEKRIAYLAQKFVTGKFERAIVVNDGARDQTALRAESLIRMIGWSDNATLLAAVMEPANQKLGDLTLKRISLTGNEAQEEIGPALPIYFHSLRLSPDRKTLAFTARQHDFDNVWLYSLATRQLRQLTNNKKAHLHLAGLNWLADGSAICFSKQSAATAIWVMEPRD